MDAMIENLMHEMMTTPNQDKVFGLPVTSHNDVSGGRDDDDARPLYLTRAEAMHLLALCVSSPFPVENGEEVLFAKLGACARRY